jgi:hypothetical protein
LYQVWRSIRRCKIFPCRKIEIRRAANLEVFLFLTLKLLYIFVKPKVGWNILPM